MYPDSLNTSGVKNGSNLKFPKLILGRMFLGIRFISNGLMEV